MTTLLTIWGVTAMIIVISFAVAWKRSNEQDETARGKFSPILSHVVWEEMRETMRALAAIAESARPHGQKLVLSSVRVLAGGRELFMRRIYGKIKIENGISASFFLKQIADHRDERKEDPERLA